MWLLKQSVDAYVCACMCRHTCVLRTFLLHVKVYFASVVHPRFSPCSSPSDARVCVPSLCLLAFRNTPACMFHTIPNLTYVAVCLPSCAVPFPRGRLASSQPKRTRLSLVLLESVLVLAASSSGCPSAWGESDCACQSRAGPAHIVNRLCEAREKLFLKAPYCYSRRLHVIPAAFLLSFQESRKIRNPTVCFLSSPARQKPLLAGCFSRSFCGRLLTRHHLTLSGGSRGRAGVYPPSPGEAALPWRPASFSSADKEEASARTQLGRPV